MRFEIVPYVGALPIMFGMSESEVVALLGEPKNRSRPFVGGTSHIYDDVNIGCSNEGRVDHIGFGPGSTVTLHGIDPFAPSGFEELIKLDGEPTEVLGSVVLLNLGIATDGFHTGEEGDKGVAVFMRGAYDDVRDRMKPYQE